jgi:hypothetical protein
VADNRQTRATLRDFLSSRGLSADSITLTPDLTTSPPSETANEGDDLGIDPNTGLPVLGLNGLTSAYVAFLTQQSDNFYNLSPQGEEAAPSTRGSPLAPPDHQGAQRIFARPGTTLGQAMQLSNSGRQDETDYPVSSYLDKTGGDDSKSGNSLLSSVQGRPNNTTGNPEIDTYVNLETQSGKMQAGVVESIANANRFNSQAGGVAVPNQLDSVDSQKLQSVQRSFSVYHKDDTATSSAYDYERLKDVGNWLLASAAGYIIPGNENERQTVDQYFTPVKRSNLTLESAAAQLNTRIGADNALTFDDVQASNARGFPKQPDGSSMRSDRGSATQPDISEAKYTRPSPVSYTSATPFDDSSNIGSSKLVQARALIAVNRLASLYNRNAVTPPSDTADTLKSLGPYYMGGSVYSRVNALNRMIMNVAYVPTRNPYPAAVEAGIGVMLGKEQIASPTQISGYFGMLPISPGFWEAVATSAVDIITKQSNLGQTLRDEGGSSKYYLDLSRSKAVQVMNVFATIGDIVLQVTGKEFNNDTFKQDIAAAVGIEQVDNLSVTAGTRIMKSREGSGRSPLALSWRGNSVPGLMLLSDNVIQASLEAGNLINGENPARGMLASSLIEKTYADPTMRGSKARIPGDIVKIIEDKLDAEYVPFYFHDLRTNEIIAFHAFLDSLQDSFSAQYASFKSYGRSDAAKMYTSTSRSVSLSFTVAATSRDDFDEMWYKLNRLIACVYPKYTEGTLVQNSDITFEQPFSQVIGATPLMRLRVGDVVKSNYSRFNLSRFFGIGNDDVDVKKYSSKTGADNASNLVGKIAKGATATANFFAGASNSIPSWWQKGAFYSIFGSPIKSIASINKLDNTQGKAILSSPIASSFVSNFLVNGFVNPIGYSLMTSWTQNPDNPLLTNLESFGGISDFNDTQNNGSFGFSFLKPRERPYDVVDGEGNKIGKATVRRALKVFVTSRKKVDRYNSPEGVLNPIKDADVPSNETRFYATVVDPSQFVPIFNDDRTSTETVGGDTLLVTHDDLQPDLGMIFAPAALIISPAEAGVDILTGLVNSAASALNLNASSVLDNVTTEGLAGFMSPNNNAIVRAFEHNRGRGLPGVITQLSFNWLDFNWETDWGARAPMGTKVTITFECMHDLPPGLDSGGYMRAPTHNVGSVMNTVAGDPYDDKGAISRTNFARDGASTIIKRG